MFVSLWESLKKKGIHFKCIVMYLGHGVARWYLVLVFTSNK